MRLEYSRMYDKRLGDLSGTAEELFNDVSSGYVEDIDQLEAICDIFNNKKSEDYDPEKALYISFYIDEWYAEYNGNFDSEIYNIGELKRDAYNGVYKLADEIPLEDYDYSLTIVSERGNIIINITDFSKDEDNSSAATTIPIKDFYEMSQKDLHDCINSVIYYWV